MTSGPGKQTTIDKTIDSKSCRRDTRWNVNELKCSRRARSFCIYDCCNSRLHKFVLLLLVNSEQGNHIQWRGNSSKYNNFKAALNLRNRENQWKCVFPIKDGHSSCFWNSLRFSNSSCFIQLSGNIYFAHWLPLFIAGIASLDNKIPLIKILLNSLYNFLVFKI